MTSDDRLNSIYLIAMMYYMENKTQNEIATELGVSRPTVSRLLSQARDKGLVQITVAHPFANVEVLAESLKQTLGLSSVVVVPGGKVHQDQIRRCLGYAAARFLESALQKGDVLGVGWGRTLYKVAGALDTKDDYDLTVVPLLGGLGQISPSFQVHTIARMFSEQVGGKWQPLYAPAIVKNINAQKSLLASRDIARIIEAWDHLAVVVVGIGNMDIGTEVQMLFADYVDAKTIENLKQANAVGDICMRFFDIEGNRVIGGLPGVISIELDQFREVPRRIGVAGGVEKAEAILGAVQGGFINILITDESAARQMLEIIATHS